MRLNIAATLTLLTSSRVIIWLCEYLLCVCDYLHYFVGLISYITKLYCRFYRVHCIELTKLCVVCFVE